MWNVIIESISSALKRVTRNQSPFERSLISKQATLFHWHTHYCLSKGSLIIHLYLLITFSLQHRFVGRVCFDNLGLFSLRRGKKAPLVRHVPSEFLSNLMILLQKRKLARILCSFNAISYYPTIKLGLSGLYNVCFFADILRSGVKFCVKTFCKRIVKKSTKSQNVGTRKIFATSWISARFEFNLKVICYGERYLCQWHKLSSVPVSIPIIISFVFLWNIFKLEEKNAESLMNTLATCLSVSVAWSD